LNIPPKYTQIRIFGLRICHLATLHLLDGAVGEEGLVDELDEVGADGARDNVPGGLLCNKC
jgi:hypothetical protein